RCRLRTQSRSMQPSEQLGATGENICRVIKQQLPREIFLPRAGQLWYGLAYTGVILACAAAMRVSPGWAKPLLGVAMGCATAGLGFLGHNLCHNSVVRGWPRRFFERLVWAIAYTPATGFINSHN